MRPFQEGAEQFSERERNAQEDAALAANSCELFRFAESEPLDTLRSLFQAHPLTQRSLVLSAAQVNTTATPGTSSEPPPSPDSRSSCDADGWLPSQKDERLLREKNACDSSRRPQTRRSSCSPPSQRNLNDDTRGAPPSCRPDAGLAMEL